MMQIFATKIRVLSLKGGRNSYKITGFYLPVKKTTVDLENGSGLQISALFWICFLGDFCVISGHFKYGDEHHSITMKFITIKGKYPMGSMGLVYLPTCATKINYSCRYINGYVWLIFSSS